MPPHRTPPGASRYGARSLWAVIGLAVLLNACQGLRQIARGLPTTPLVMAAPIDWGTRGKLAALGRDTPRCLALLDVAGVSHTILPAVRQDQCGYADGVRLERGGALPVAFHPGLAVACPVAAGLTIWQREIVQPSARRHFGKAVIGIDHYGGFACRRIGGRSTGDFSEHASARAIDIAGFRLAGGGRVTVRQDWDGEPARAAFLREVRDGGCRLFGTVLSPEYNAAHADHLHFDSADRGFGGFCR